MDKRFSHILRIASALLLLVLLAGCQQSVHRTVTYHSETASSIVTTDYSRPDRWAIQAQNITHPVDVFFVHPTTYGPPSNGKLNADLDDAKLNALTDRMAVRWMTAAFSDHCNVFAPRYRQMNIEVLAMSEQDRARYLEVAIRDVQAAFAYYLEHLNQGRPFILASHSQGSNVLLDVLLRHPNMLDKSKLVAAYMPGWTFTAANRNALGLHLGTAPDQTGVLLTWNTVGPDGKSPTVSKGATCVNPLSWTTNTKEVPTSANKGARIYMESGNPLTIDHFTAARIADQNGQQVLEIPTPKPDVLKQLNMSMGPEVYHRYDYDFFFNNIRDNVATRCAAYLKGE
ncbi:MAG: DUF3089 domain-containing protein [Desulfovibrio sp.]|uniref:DUF3089 domain-containing protein n=1 Tax=Desulfovibrio sp. 7SRBS1 TaxID=3378064 RepID=UPI003B3D0B7D